MTIAIAIAIAIAIVIASIFALDGQIFVLRTSNFRGATISR